MKRSTTIRLFLFLGLLYSIAGCKKNSTEPLFRATANNKVYSFDSLFTWIDTSSAYLNHYFINIGAKDTKGNNLIYFAADNYGDKNFTGTYFFAHSLPYPLPSRYKWINGGRVFLSNGQNQDCYAIGGNGVSKLSIEKITASTLQGPFSISVNPVRSDGSADFSQSLAITGQFNVPYHFIP